MNLTDLGIVGVGTLTVIVFLICTAVKATPLDNKWLPVIAGVSGAALGVAAMYVMPDFPAHDILSSLAIGIVSGFAATGIHQVYKQQSKAGTGGESNAK